jgi:alkanesulfonate monooxygenase SsuD/methylene tetrahydromethanopterin reductase-like flavin-dependent oxidoreductase (luciferase family)
MRLGLIHINMRPMNHPDALVQAARAAEQAGFDSVWAGEHLVVPDPQVPPSPMAPPAPSRLASRPWPVCADPRGSRPERRAAIAWKPA